MRDQVAHHFGTRGRALGDALELLARVAVGLAVRIRTRERDAERVVGRHAAIELDEHIVLLVAADARVMRREQVAGADVTVLERESPPLEVLWQLLAAGRRVPMTEHA